MKFTKRFFYILLLLGCIIFLYVFLKVFTNSLTEQSVIRKVEQNTQQGRSLPIKNQSSSDTKSTNTQSIFYKVLHVADGDTIDILKNNQKTRLRLLGINSPESVAENRPDECYGKEAGEYMKNLVTGKSVSIEYDTDKPDRDKYNRELVYVYLENGASVNKSMISTGNAYEYTYNSEKYKYQSEYKQAQLKAKEQGLGLWASNTCNGKK